MTTPGFIEAGLAAIRKALLAAADRAGLTLRHYAISQAAARRFRVRVRLLETTLRRLLVLMAANLIDKSPRAHPERPHPERPDPERPVPAKAGAEGPAKAGTACPAGDAPQPGPHRRPGPFTLIPVARYDAARLEALRNCPPTVRQTPEIAPLLHRYCTLMHHLGRADRLARRMAHHLARLRAAGEPRPVCLPAPETARLGSELGLVASILPGAVSTALATWYDTG